jgi:hypothetical protein
MSAGTGSSSERAMADSTSGFTGVWRVVAEASPLARGGGRGTRLAVRPG